MSSSSAPQTKPGRAVSPAVIAGVFLVISALYFADTMQRAAMKDFWFDEIISVFLCRLPSFGATWAAVMHGMDFNPPLFYLLMRGSERLFGEGLIASRLPAILGFWIFGACLYSFVSRRLGRMAGCVAALFPIFTLAHKYAYEARPHAIVLGWCGLMLVCWQRAREDKARSFWTIAFALSWLAALLTHVYSVYLFVPFAAVELLALKKYWRINAGILVSLCAAPACVLPLYLRMMHTYKQATSLGGLPAHIYDTLQRYLVAVISPGIAILLLALLLLACTRVRKPGMADADSLQQRRLLPWEFWLSVGLACLPVVGAIGVKLTHGPFFERYFLAGTAGYAILLAQVAIQRGQQSLVVKGLVGAMLFLLAGDIVLVSTSRLRHAPLDQVEPASEIHFSPDSHQPFLRDEALLRNHGTQPILIPNEHTYYYVYFYGSPTLRHRIYLGIPPFNDFSLSGFQEEQKWLRLEDFHVSGLSAFLATHDDFFMYDNINGAKNGPCFDCLQPVLDAGFTLRSVDRDDDNLLEHFTR